MSTHHARRAKILITMGPALEDPARLEAALKAGANAVSINFSHGDSVQHVRYLKLVRSVAAKLGQPCAVLACCVFVGRLTLGHIPGRFVALWRLRGPLRRFLVAFGLCHCRVERHSAPYLPLRRGGVAVRSAHSMPLFRG